MMVSSCVGTGWIVLFARKRGKGPYIIHVTGRDAWRFMAAAVLSVLVALALFSDIPASVRTWTEWSLPLSGKVIALDAGHGGIDGGAVSRTGVVEKDINLAIALYLRDYLQQAGAVVALTREGDYDLAAPETRGTASRKTEDLHERVRRIEGQGAVLAVSIHLNSIPSARWRGAQTFYSPKRPDSQRLALAIQRELRESLGNTNREALAAEEVFLLNELDMPSALVEVGFLSNPQESELLADPGYQRKVAAAVYRGILRFLTEKAAGDEALAAQAARTGLANWLPKP